MSIDDLIRLFKDLPDMAKVAVFLVLMFVVIALTVWKVFSWRAVQALKKALKRKERELQEIAKERDQLQSRFEALDQIDNHVWTKPDAFHFERFIPPGKRSTRFLALCNLKGGVGKTTLTLNLGVCLALTGKKVLLVDLDFQGTLSNLALEQGMLVHARSNGLSSDRLLNGDEDFDWRPIAFPMAGVANCRVIISREYLELVEFEEQSRFFVSAEHEVRFHLQRCFHDPEAMQEYDYVLFDCPPRMSTACINALACADHILIPTSLSQMDIEAVPRTLRWLKELHAVVQGSFLGAVLTRARMRRGDLIAFEQRQLGNLKQIIADHQPGEGFVFSAMIPDHPKVHQFSAQRQAIAAHSEDGRRWFDGVREEFERKIGR